MNQTKHGHLGLHQGQQGNDGPFLLVANLENVEIAVAAWSAAQWFRRAERSNVCCAGVSACASRREGRS